GGQSNHYLWRSEATVPQPRLLDRDHAPAGPGARVARLPDLDLPATVTGSQALAIGAKTETDDRGPVPLQTSEVGTARAIAHPDRAVGQAQRQLHPVRLECQTPDVCRKLVPFSRLQAHKIAHARHRLLPEVQQVLLRGRQPLCLLQEFPYLVAITDAP